MLASSSSTFAADKFIGPKAIERKTPSYPDKRARRSHSGAVEVSMMVKKDGTVYAPIARMSTHEDFEETSLRAVKKYKFEPATVNGNPVDSHYEIIIFYSMVAQKDAVTKGFSRALKSAKKELAKKEPVESRVVAKIKAMKKQNHLSHYSLMYLATLELEYANRFKNDAAKLEAFEKLFLFDRQVGEGRRLLNEDLLLWAKQSVLNLRLKSGQLALAYAEYLSLQREDPNSSKPFEESMAKTKAILTSGKPFTQKVELGKRGYKEVFLVATKFELKVQEGQLQKLIFRCQKGFSEIDFKANSEYQVPKKWGECWMQISGSANARAHLTQFK